MHRQESRPSSQRQRGVVMILLGLAIVMLIGFAGLAIDLGRFFLIKTELQNAVDACSLAAASQLRPGQNNNQALIKAVAYGRVFSTGGTGDFSDIKNRGNFQSTVIDITDITFSRTLTFPDAGVTFDTAKYVKCAYPLSDIPVFFMKVLDPSQVSVTVSASAVATQGPSASVCAIPIGICAVSGEPASSNYGLNVGQWYTVKNDGNPVQGWAGWIDYTPPAGGDQELKDWLKGSGQCDLQITNNISVQQSGNMSNLAEYWNSRFGWYKTLNVNTAPPDFSGFSYSAAAGGNWLIGANAWGGSSPLNPGVLNYRDSRGRHPAFQGNIPPGVDTAPTANTYTILASGQVTPPARPPEPSYAANGKNRRISVAPVLNCTNAPATITIKDWACVLMLNPYIDQGDDKGKEWRKPNLEFLGLSTTIGSVCSSGGGPGTAGAPVPVLAQ